MKKNVPILFILLCLFANIHSQSLKPILDYQVFALDNLQPYLEMTLIIRGESPLYVEKEEGYVAEVIMNVRLQNKNTQEIVDSFSYYLYSAPKKDPNSVKNDFGEIYRRLIDTGEYVIYFNIKDVNDPERKWNWMDVMSANFPSNQISVSDINLLSSFSEAESDDFFERYGYNLIPKYDNFYPQKIGNLSFFMEVYNAPTFFSSNEKVKIKSFIKNINSSSLDLSYWVRESLFDADSVIVILDQYDIRALPSGNYHLGVEVYDGKGEVKTRTICSFQRSNPAADSLYDKDDVFSIENTFVAEMTDPKVLREHISSMYPIADPMERKLIRTEANNMSLEDMQLYFYSFWHKRMPDNPQLAWLAYYEKVKHVDREFGSKLIRGYRTDRGRIFLQYGPPNSIRKSDYSPTTHPYQIWHYYEIEKEMNIRFVFYTTDFVSNDYTLLHSNKKDEVREPAWQILLLKGHNARDDFDQTRPEDFYGNDMDENWNNP